MVTAVTSGAAPARPVWGSGRELANVRAVIVRPTPEAEAGYEAGRRFIAGLEDEWRTLVGPRRWATFRAVLAEIAAHEERRSG